MIIKGVLANVDTLSNVLQEKNQRLDNTYDFVEANLINPGAFILPLHAIQESTKRLLEALFFRHLPSLECKKKYQTAIGGLIRTSLPMHRIKQAFTSSVRVSTIASVTAKLPGLAGLQSIRFRLL